MADAFQGKYAQYYDLLYRDKDYEKETDFVEQIFRKFSRRPIKTILDLGCGTGGHAIPLARRGYNVTGIDASENMIAAAREKCQEHSLDVRFHCLDMRHFELRETFDACICMFNAFGYVTKDSDIQLVLKNVKKHLRPGCPFVFDCWNGLAVLRILPSVRVKEGRDGEKKVIRIAQPRLKAYQHLCEVNYHLIVTQNNTIVDDTEETHEIRFLFPQEIVHHLEENGFKVSKICPSMELDGETTAETWNITTIAQAL